MTGAAGISVGYPLVLMRERDEAQRLKRALVGLTLPSVSLTAIDGDPIDLAGIAFGWVVYYFYPGTGTPPAHGADGPAEDIAEHRAYRDRQSEFEARRMRTVGVSSQAVNAQLRTALANDIGRHSLLSDPELLLADELGLPTFDLDEKRWYRRLTLLTLDRRIEQVFFPVSSGARNPSQVLAWLQLREP
jgi:peroxiredoxin